MFISYAHQASIEYEADSWMVGVDIWRFSFLLW